jgi:hypothetical protein
MSDYQEAIQNPSSCFKDGDLRAGAPRVNGLGLPMPITGGFASVYQINCRGALWAVRCFLRDFSDQQLRYEAVASHLRAARLPYSVNFHFARDGICVLGNWYPILKMEWISGLPLNDFIKTNLRNASVLKDLLDKWTKLAQDLRCAGVAHGDLQHGNVLVANGQLRLIDYDGMFVPSLKGVKGHESGHPCYQHPKRGPEDFGADIDRFSVFAVHLAVLALQTSPDLWDQFNNDDNILFRRDDFQFPSRSPLFHLLRGHSDRQVAVRARALEHCCRSDLSTLPDVETDFNGRGLPGWIVQVELDTAKLESSPASEAVALSFRFHTGWSRPGHRITKVMRTEPVYGTKTRTTYRQEPVYEEKTRFSEKTETNSHIGVALLAYLAFQIIGLVIHPGLLCLTSTIGAFIFSAVETKKKVQIPEKYREQVGTKDVPIIESYQEQTGTKSVEEKKQTWEPGQSGAVRAIAFSRNGRLLASVGDDCGVILWEADGGVRVAQAKLHEQRVSGVVAVGDADFASSSWDQSIRIWGADGRVARIIRNDVSSRFYAVACTEDGTLIAGALGKKEVLVWRANSGDRIGSFRGHSRKVLCLAFARNGSALVSGSSDMSVRVWSISRKECELVLYGHSDDVLSVGVSGDGTQFCSGGSDGFVFVWDRSGNQVHRIPSKGGAVNCVLFAFDSQAVIGGCADGTVRCWNLASGREDGEPLRLGDPVLGISIAPGSKRIAACGASGRIAVWEHGEISNGIIASVGVSSSAGFGIPASVGASGSGELCPRCSKPLRKVSGRYGLFWGCTGWPSCKFTKNV